MDSQHTPAAQASGVRGRWKSLWFALLWSSSKKLDCGGSLVWWGCGQMWSLAPYPRLLKPQPQPVRPGSFSSNQTLPDMKAEMLKKSPQQPKWEAAFVRICQGLCFMEVESLGGRAGGGDLGVCLWLLLCCRCGPAILPRGFGNGPPLQPGARSLTLWRWPPVDRWCLATSEVIRLRIQLGSSAPFHELVGVNTCVEHLALMTQNS